MMWNTGWLWSQCSGSGLNLKLIWGIPRYFVFLWWHHCPSKHVTVCLGTLWRYQANQGSLRVWWGTWYYSACNAGESSIISWWMGSLIFFLELWREPWVYSRVTVGMILQSSCLFSDIKTPVYLRGTPQESPWDLEGQQMLLMMKRETQCKFLFATVILEFLSIFNKSQALSPFEALNSPYL